MVLMLANYQTGIRVQGYFTVFESINNTSNTKADTGGQTKRRMERNKRRMERIAIVVFEKLLA